MKLTSRDLPRSYWQRVAQRNGILRNTFNYRLRAGWAIEKAATKPVNSGGRAKQGAKPLCREAGLHEESVYQYRRARNGAPELTDEEIVNRLKAHHARVSISELARESGVSRATISRRLARGWSVEKATRTPPTPPQVSARMAKKGKGHTWAAKWEGAA
jgi:DNA invertase Pin-like site-specific DNA recombinase